VLFVQFYSPKLGLIVGFLVSGFKLSSTIAKSSFCVGAVVTVPVAMLGAIFIGFDGVAAAGNCCAAVGVGEL